MKATQSSMKYSNHPRKPTIPIVGFLLLILLISNRVFAQPTFVGVSSNPADGGSLITATVTITPPGSMQAGDLVVIYAHYRNTGATLTVSTSGGQTWTSETANSGGSETTRIFWCRFNGTWGANPVVSGGNGSAPISAIMYAFRPTSSTSLWGINVAQTNSSSTNTAISITGLTTTLPNTVTMAFWGSPAATTWGAVSGTGWVKPTFPVSATQVTNTGGSDLSHTAAYNIRTSAGAVANTSQTQSSSQNTRTSIISWYEINDECSGAISLTSSISCSNTPGTLTGATYTTLSGACGASSGNRNDVWYSFVAQSVNPTITLSSAPTQASIQLFSGSCGSLSSEQCALSSNTLTASGLSIGNTYFVRIFSNNNTTGTFNICVTDPPPLPANDDCSSAIGLTSAASCGTPTNGTLLGATNVALSTCNPTNADVWYSFTAQTPNPTITIGGSVGASARFEVLSGTCGGTLTDVFCSTSANQATSGLTVGTTYFVRVYTTGTANTFTICITDPVPSNNAFGSPTALTPGTTCTNTTGTLYLGTFTSGTPTISGSCVSGTVSSDVWYSFVAPADVVTISLSGAGSDVTGVEVVTTISGTTYSIACGGSTGIPVVNVVAGSTYLVRVYKTGTAPSAGVNSAFNICVTVTPVPNDECSGAINLNVSANCNKVFGTVSMATPSSGIPTNCGTATSFDVWYKFTATSTNPTISLADFGSGFSSSTGNPRRMEIYSGNCGSLTFVQCTSSNSSPFTVSPTLTVGTTYYIRIYKETGTATGDGKFSICITSGATSNVRTGNSYVNVTKNTTGGVVEPGDILEIRMTIWVGYPSTGNTTLYNARYVDNVPAKTAMQTGSEIQIITNEGLRYRGYTATDGLNDDAATYKSSPGAGEYNIRLNLGTSGALPGAPADNTATDLTGANNLVSTTTVVPRAGNGLLFATSFRVQVTGNVGDTINLNGGQFIYETTAGGPDLSITGIPYKILITDPLTLCANSVGVNNASEYGGTFGSGSTLNRPTDLSFPIAGYSFVAANSAQAIGDGQYALVNNTSPRGGTNESAFFAPLTTTTPPDKAVQNRMFGGFWYIDGDHSGTNNAAGNNPVAPGTPGGYMLAVNADYVASEAYRQTLTGLCPNTYYEFSAWMKNICPLCGIDSLGKQFTNSAIVANQAGYPGVLPNLTFSMDGLDRYSTGQIDIGGENGGWIKKGFVFKTDSTQTSATLSIRNNSQGGGGNDWVMDDISIATCFPSMSYSPTATPAVCSGNTIQIGDTVRSQFSNYAYYVWQRSQDGGLTWTDLTTAQTAVPSPVSGQYQYITTLNVPTANTTLADSGDIYRVYTGTTLANIINPNCVANDGSAPISLSVLDCGIVLKTDLLSFNGNLMNKYAVLSWSTSKEEQPVHFELQRSDDNILFNTIALINGKNDGQKANYYSFTDPQQVTEKKWYRVLMIFDNRSMKYSHAIQLNTASVDFDVENVINPFSSQLLFNILTSKSAKADVELIDMQGKTVKTTSFLVYSGSNSLRIPNTDVLAPGIYTLRIQCNDKSISKKVVKNNN